MLLSRLFDCGVLPAKTGEGHPRPLHVSLRPHVLADRFCIFLAEKVLASSGGPDRRLDGPGLQPVSDTKGRDSEEIR